MVAMVLLDISQLVQSGRDTQPVTQLSECCQALLVKGSCSCVVALHACQVTQPVQRITDAVRVVYFAISGQALLEECAGCSVVAAMVGHKAHVGGQGVFAVDIAYLSEE